MRHKGVVTAAVTTVLALSFVMTAAQGAASTPGVSGTHVSLTKLPSGAGSLAYRSPFTAGIHKSANNVSWAACSALPSGDDAGGIYSFDIGTSFVLDWTTGNLTLCRGVTGVDSVIQVVPSAVAGDGYYGLSSKLVSGSLDLLLLSWGVEGGWYCLGATTSGCASTSWFTLPSTFCSAQPVGYCNPDGVVLNMTLGFTYVDSVNKDMVSCTASAASCTTDAASSAFAGYKPIGIAERYGKFFVSDNSCTGNIWVGTTTSMKVLYTEGNSLEAIAFREHILFVADDAYCGGNASILFAKGGGVQSYPYFTGSIEIVGLDKELQFTTWSPGAVYDWFVQK